jgi:hypothetical protein
MLGFLAENIVQTRRMACRYILHRVRVASQNETIIMMIESDAVRAILLLLSSLLFSLLAK